mgnify:CR=1 FL=1
MPIGVIINTIAIFLGGIAGALLGDKLPEISAIPGYSFVGFIKNEAETKKIKEDSKENVISQQNDKRQPQLKEITNTSVIDKKQETKTTLTNTDKIEDKRYVLKKNEYYVMGDTETSFDSRYLGILRKKDFKSEVKLLIKEETLEKIMDKIEGKKK